MSPFFSKRRVSFVSGALLCASLVSACSSLEPAQGVSARNELKPQATATTRSAPKDESTALVAPPSPP
ncbi:VWA domain-containing protein, partial [Corallococcus exiguus]|nr:VWA domain-containing protein [Corallococcus exiguus]